MSEQLADEQATAGSPVMQLVLNGHGATDTVMNTAEKTSLFEIATCRPLLVQYG
ncbi:hypothetical protein ACFUVV_04080 [Streptomyces sp. NPDC057376]|uniref:hypothetical protein n=1 Tax=unclassified Streptomyces TaxID=2593676 RepID=UPI0018E92D4A|nr:hypothetical protein [Streptomyces sp. CB02414]